MSVKDDNNTNNGGSGAQVGDYSGAGGWLTSLTSSVRIRSPRADTGARIASLVYRLRIDLDRVRARLGNGTTPADEKVARLFLEYMGLRPLADGGEWLASETAARMLRDGEIVRREVFTPPT